MTENATSRDDGARVLQLRAVDAQTEVALEEAKPGGGEPAVYLDTTDLTGARRPIIPKHWQRGNARATASQIVGHNWHRARFHGVRVPGYAAKVFWYAVRGVFVVSGKILAWWHWTEGWELESQAVAAGRPGHHEAMGAHKEGKKTRAQRGKIIGVSLALLFTAMVAMVRFAPVWVWGLAAIGAVVFLSMMGRPKGKPIAQSAVVKPSIEPPTHPVITKALGSLGIEGINRHLREGNQIAFLTDVHRDGEGWRTDLDLPHGVTATMILAKRSQFASGLRRPLSATWPTPVPHEHEGRMEVWIGYHDISKAKPKPHPLLKGGSVDMFTTVPFGTDPRGTPVPVPLFECNWLFGAAPGQGKTAAVRSLIAGPSLDPICDLWLHELAGKGDLEPYAKVSHRYVSGLDDESIAYTADSVTRLRAELEKRSKRFGKLPREAKPDGKVTRALAQQKALGLRPLVCVIDEVQNLFSHPEYGKQAAEDAAYVIRVGRAYGLILILSTQRPDKDAVPTQVSGNVTMRFCLKVPGYMENDLILGTGAYKNGFDATAFRAKTDAGLGWLRAEGMPQVVRTYYLNLDDTEKIAKRARQLREQAGVLSGYALGEADESETRDFLADVLSVFGGADKLWTETIAVRLAQQIPGIYSDITQEAVASQLRNLAVPVKNVREAGEAPRKGCERATIEAVRGAVNA